MLNGIWPVYDNSVRHGLRVTIGLEDLPQVSDTGWCLNIRTDTSTLNPTTQPGSKEASSSVWGTEPRRFAVAAQGRRSSDTWGRSSTAYPFNEVTAVFLLNNPRYHYLNQNISHISSFSSSSYFVLMDAGQGLVVTRCHRNIGVIIDESA